MFLGGQCRRADALPLCGKGVKPLLPERLLFIQLSEGRGGRTAQLLFTHGVLDGRLTLGGIAVGSGLQIALFVAPLLVLIGALMGTPMSLVFHPFELIAMIGAGLIAVLVSVDGESNWLEGAQLIALYLMFGIAFYFVP